MSKVVTEDTLFSVINDIQYNIESIQRTLYEIQTGDIFDGGASTFFGAWSGSSPGPTSGQSFVIKNDGLFIISCECSAFQNTGGTGATIQVDVYLDQINVGSMTLSASTSTNVRLTLPRFASNISLIAGTHYIYFRQVQGTSDVNDQGSIVLTRIG